MMTADQTAEWVRGYHQLGWHVLPLPAGRKFPPPDGTTGADGVDLTEQQALLSIVPSGNLGLRMPEGVVGIDVDAYGEKQGAETLFALQLLHGNLPDSPRLTSRPGDPWSGIRFFRVAAGFELGFLGKDVDTIRRGWRYAVAAPSVHPETGRQYQWLDRDGRPCRPPDVSELPDLPAAWVEAFPLKSSEGSGLSGTGRHGRELIDYARQWFDALPEGLAECSSVADAREEGVVAASRRGTSGTARNDLLGPVMKLALQGEAGCPGVREAIAQVGGVYTRLPRGEDHAEKFWHLLGSTLDRLGEARPWDCDHLTREERDMLPELALSLASPGPDPAVDDDNPRGWLDWGDDFWRLTKPPMLVPGVLAEGGVALVYCGPGRGKSLVWQDVCAGFAVRGRVLGVEVEPQPVVYVDHENSMTDIRDRLGSMGLTARDAGGLRERFHYSLLGDWPPLNTRDGGDALIAEVQRLGARLVVLDTNSKLVMGEENSNDTWQGLHVHTVKRLKRLGVAVVQLDHSGKDEERGVRGGSAKTNNVDVVWKLWAAPGDKPGVRTLECEKDRPSAYGGVGAVAQLDVRYHPLEHVLRSGGAGLEPAVEKMMEAEAKVEAIVDALDALGVDPAFNRAKVRPILRDQAPGLKASNADLDQAIKRRRGGQETA